MENLNVSFCYWTIGIEQRCIKDFDNKTMQSIMSGQDNVVMNHVDKQINILNTCFQDDAKHCKTE